MMRAIERGTIKMEIEIAVVGRQFHHLLALDQFFFQPPISDQALDGADAEAVLFLEFHQLRQPGHRAVIVQDFAENTGGLQTSHAREIDRRFGVPRTSKDAAVLRAKRKDVTGLDQVVRGRFWIRDRLDRRRAIVRADPGRDPARRID